MVRVTRTGSTDYHNPAGKLIQLGSTYQRGQTLSRSRYDGADHKVRSKDESHGRGSR